MDAVIISEFCEREIFDPGVGVFTAVNAEIGFEFLIHLFSLAISLRMISGGEGIGVLEKMAEF